VLGWRNLFGRWVATREICFLFDLGQKKKKTRGGTIPNDRGASARMLPNVAFYKELIRMRRLQLLSFLSFTDTQQCYIQKDNGGFLSGRAFPTVGYPEIFCFRTRCLLSLFVIITYLTQSIVFMSTIFLNRLVLDGPYFLSCAASKVLQVMKSKVIQASVSEISCIGQLAQLIHFHRL